MYRSLIRFLLWTHNKDNVLICYCILKVKTINPFPVLTVLLFCSQTLHWFVFHRPRWSRALSFCSFSHCRAGPSRLMWFYFILSWLIVNSAAKLWNFTSMVSINFPWEVKVGSFENVPIRKLPLGIMGIIRNLWKLPENWEQFQQTVSYPNININMLFWHKQ